MAMPGVRVRAALAHHEVGGEVVGGPVAAEGGRVGADGVQQVGQGGALGAGE